MEEIMKIFNTLTRRKDEFVPIEEGKVRMYYSAAAHLKFAAV